MASEYAYITLAELENFMGMDVDGRDTALTDAKVESMITLAERLINGFIGESLSGTIPDAIQSATMIIASNIVHNWLYRETTIEGEEKPVFDNLAKQMLESYISKEQQDSVDLLRTNSGSIRTPAEGWYWYW